MEKLNRIKIVLAEKDVKQKDLAKKLGVRNTTVNNYCQNNTQPPLEGLKKIAEILEVCICDLINE